MCVIRRILVSFLHKHYIFIESIKKPTTIKITLLGFAVRDRYNPEDKVLYLLD